MKSVYLCRRLSRALSTLGAERQNANSAARPDRLKEIRMKRTIAPLLLTATLLLMASCLNSDDSDTTYYNDTAITTFTLGTMKRYITTTASDGVTDSTYSTTVTGSLYKFYIDQNNRKIYNVDSLPYGTDASKVLATIYVKNSGTVYLKSLTSDSLYIYSSSDSLDFSQPRELRVYTYDGSNTIYRAYTVNVNVHQEPADTFFWTKMPEGTEIPEAVTFGGSPNTYKIENGELLKSSDGGSTWTTETLDRDAAWLPDANVSFCSKASNTNDSTDIVLLTGTSDADPDYAVCWLKYDDYEQNAFDSEWSYTTGGAANLYPLPKLENLCVVRFSEDYVLAIGGKGLDNCDEAPYSSIYVSHDNGISWIPDDVFRMPEDFDTSATNVKMTVDSNNRLWLVSEGTGEIWCGRLSQNASEKAQTSFRE